MKLTSLIYAVSATGLWAANDTPEMAKQRAAAMYGKLPLSFERNEGQADARVRFLARGRGYGLFLTRREAVLSLAGAEKQKYGVLRVGLTHARAGVDPVGVDAFEGKSNYFTGKNPNQWHTGITQYAAVKYASVYPGIDLVYHGDQGQLEYDFDLAPGADSRRIELRFQGARHLRIDKAGDLVVSLGASELVEHRPLVYQEAQGKRELVAGSYVLRGPDRVGFRLASYDRSREVVIDPTLVFSTLLGGTGDNFPSSVKVDTEGNAYVTGSTSATNFPVTPGAFETSHGECFGCDYAFVAKLNSTGSALLYSTYLGGVSESSGGSIAIDAAGNVFVTGETSSTDFPVTPGALQAKFGGDPYDAFVTKLNASGSALLYSTLLGGSDWDQPFSIAIDSAGDAYVTGFTLSVDFPVTPGAFQTSFGGGVTNAWVAKLNATGSALLYSTFLGGSEGGFSFGIAIDAAGNAYVTGATPSGDFPVTAGAFQDHLIGSENAFVTKLNSSGSAAVYSTYLGGGGDIGNAIAVDSAGNAFVTGSTNSTVFPITPGAFQTRYGGGVSNAFVTKLSPSGSALLFSTFLGGSGPYGEAGVGITIGASGEVYLTGFTSSTDFPVTPGAFQTGFLGSVSSHAFVTELNPAGSALLYSTFLGGDGGDGGSGITLDAAGMVYVTGNTYGDFPVTPGAFQTSSSVSDVPVRVSCEPCSDAFVTKLDLAQLNPTIKIAAVLAGPPKQVQFSSQNTQSGLATIQVLQCTNCTAATESFTRGTKDPVITTATKTDQTRSSLVEIEATDLNGNTTTYDPTDITIQADGRAEVQEVRISGLEHLVMINNGTPGVRAIVLRVRGKDVPVLSLKDGETRTVDIARELTAGRDNEVTVLSWGPRGASASVVFTQP